jgi:hypothetical protein
MQAPIILSHPFGHGAEMAVALIVGAGFGFVLERAGFGRADNMAAIFYGRDFRVMRVMFTAIVTAMLGVYFLDLAGVMPIGNLGLLPTYLVPQLVGGLLLGAGFVIGGYCPGTSLVASMSGKVDAIFFLVGILGGTVLFTVGYDAIAGFHSMTAMGPVLIHERLGLPSAVVVFAITVLATGMLWAGGRIEAIVRARLERQGVKP